MFGFGKRYNHTEEGMTREQEQQISGAKGVDNGKER